MENIIPKWWSDQYSALTSLKPTVSDYLTNQDMFKDERCIGDKDPAGMWMAFFFLCLIIAFGISIVF